jgi:hypothetical protein
MGLGSGSNSGLPDPKTRTVIRLIHHVYAPVNIFHQLDPLGLKLAATKSGQQAIRRAYRSIP